MERDKATALLARERDRIERALADLAPADERVSDPREDDPGPEVLEATIGTASAEQLQDALAAVARAEARLADGSYGLSVESGEPIPEGRLEAVPWAERTAAEQERYERG